MPINFTGSLIKTFSHFAFSTHRHVLIRSFSKIYTRNVFSRVNINSDFRFRYFAITSSLRNIENVEEKLETKKIFAEKVTFYFKDPKGNIFEVEGGIGDTLLNVAQNHNVDLPGSCTGQIACSTCHVYVDDILYEIIGPPSDEMEDDMLDKAAFPKETSRLGCQLIVSKEYKGRTFTLPLGTVNFCVDGHKLEH